MYKNVAGVTRKMSPKISLERPKLETSNFVHWLTT